MILKAILDPLERVIHTPSLIVLGVRRMYWKNISHSSAGDTVWKGYTSGDNNPHLTSWLGDVELGSN